MTRPASRLRRSPIGAEKRALLQSEKEFQAQVEELAATLGWWTYHVYAPQFSPAGWPDLVMFRERVIFAELKVRRPRDGRAGKLETQQVEMAHRCFRAGAEYYAWWFPDDWEEIKAVLSRGGSVTAE